MARESDRTRRIREEAAGTRIPPAELAGDGEWWWLDHPDLRSEPDPSSAVEGAQRPLFSKVALRVEELNGRLICTGLHVECEQRELTGAMVRDVPIGALAPWAALFAQSRNPKLAEAAPPRPRGPKGYSDDHWQLVADRYREALRIAPKQPVVWVYERFRADAEAAGEIPRDIESVRRWVRHVRNKTDLLNDLGGQR